MKITAIEALESYGFSKKEIKIYLTILQLGNTTANEISKKSQINRSTTYDILKSLIEKGICSKTTIEKTSHYQVITPEKLIDDLEEKKQKIKDALAEFKIIQKTTTTKPQIKIFEGKSGFKTILTDVLNTNKPIQVISTSKVFDVLMYEFPHYIEERKKKRIFAQVIQEESKQTKQLQKKDSQELRETRSLKNFNTDSMIWIYGNKVSTIKLIKNEIICINIMDETLAKDQKAIFEILWNNSKK